MRAVEHWQLANDLAVEVANRMQDGRLGDNDVEQISVLLAQGQLHATLALAGATALASYCRVEGSDGELADWEHAAGGEDE